MGRRMFGMRRRGRRRASRVRRRSLKPARSAKTRRSFRRKVNNHTFVRATGVIVANTDSPTGVAPTVIVGSTDDFPTPTAIVGEISPYGNTSSWTSSLVFAMGRSANASELTALYDQYRIKYVDVEFVYAAESGSADDVGTPMPSLCLLSDYDDNAPETRIQHLQSISRIFRRSLKNKIVYRVKPRVRTVLGTSATSGSVGGVATFKSYFIDCDQTLIPHYGLKVMCYDWPLFNDRTEVGVHMSKPVLRVNIKYCLEMKNVR